MYGIQYVQNKSEYKLKVSIAKLDVIKVHGESYDRPACSSETGYNVAYTGIRTYSRSKITKHLNKQNRMHCLYPGCSWIWMNTLLGVCIDRTIWKNWVTQEITIDNIDMLEMEEILW